MYRNTKTLIVCGDNTLVIGMPYSTLALQKQQTIKTTHYQNKKTHKHNKENHHNTSVLYKQRQ